jgi:hypothetical protein
MVIKEEYLDLKISSPLTGKHEWIRFIPKQDYFIYFNSYPYLFEEQKQENDIPINNTIE